MENEKNMLDKLSDMGIAYASLKPKVQEYLIQIEKYIQEDAEAKEQVLKILRKDNLNAKSIAGALGISRTTLYNNSVLKDYIEHSATKAEDINPFDTIDELRKSKALLQDQVNKMVARDVDSEQIKHEKRILEDAVKTNKEEIKRLHERINELATENERLKHTTREKLS